MSVRPSQMKFDILDRRVGFSLLTSVCLIIFAIFYLRPEVVSERPVNDRSIALLLDYVNEVQRKPMDGLLWIDLKKGEALEEGDLVRTSVNSSAEIQFQDGAASLRLGPETTLFVSKVAQGLDIEMLEGDIYLDAKGEDQELALRARGESFQVQSAQLSMSLSDQGELGVDVIEGKIKNAGQNLEISRNERLTINEQGAQKGSLFFQFIKPEIGKEIFIDPQKQMVEFRWEKKQDDYQFDLFVGRSRDTLLAVPSESHDQSSLWGEVAPGVFYWQIKGQRADDEIVESPILQSHFTLMSSPVLVSPSQNGLVQLREGEVASFRWSNQSLKEEVKFELARDVNFEEIVHFASVDKMMSFDLPLALEEGKYFWRIRGLASLDYPELVSEVASFDVRYFSGIESPRLLTPPDQSIFRTALLNELSLSWSFIASASSYELTLSNQKDFTRVIPVEQTYFVAKDLKEGSYSWSVTSVDRNGQKSEQAYSSRFTIRSYPVIEWGSFERRIYASDEGAQVSLQWKTIPEAQYYKLSLTHEKYGTRVETAQQGRIQLSLKELGTFQVLVEAYRGQELLAQSREINLDIVEHPLLSSPLWSTQSLALRESSSFGELELSFSEVEGASYYLIEVRDLTSRIVKVEQSSSTSAKLDSLLPGEYLIYVRSVDRFNRRSDLGAALSISVPETSGLEKPTLQRIQVR